MSGAKDLGLSSCTRNRALKHENLKSVIGLLPATSSILIYGARVRKKRKKREKGRERNKKEGGDKYTCSTTHLIQHCERRFLICIVLQRRIIDDATSNDSDCFIHHKNNRTTRNHNVWMVLATDINMYFKRDRDRRR